MGLEIITQIVYICELGRFRKIIFCLGQNFFLWLSYSKLGSDYTRYVSWNYFQSYTLFLPSSYDLNLRIHTPTLSLCCTILNGARGPVSSQHNGTSYCILVQRKGNKFCILTFIIFINKINNTQYSGWRLSWTIQQSYIGLTPPLSSPPHRGNTGLTDRYV